MSASKGVPNKLKLPANETQQNMIQLFQIFSFQFTNNYDKSNQFGFFEDLENRHSFSFEAGVSTSKVSVQRLYCANTPHCTTGFSLKLQTQVIQVQTNVYQKFQT